MSPVGAQVLDTTLGTEARRAINSRPTTVPNNIAAERLTIKSMDTPSSSAHTSGAMTGTRFVVIASLNVLANRLPTTSWEVGKRAFQGNRRGKTRLGDRLIMTVPRFGCQPADFTLPIPHKM